MDPIAETPNEADAVRLAAMDNDELVDRLYPQYRRYIDLYRQEGAQALERILHSEHPPATKDVAAKRSALLKQLGDLDDLETKLRMEKEKTGRVRFMLMGDAVRTLGSIMSSNITAQGGVKEAAFNAYTRRLDQLTREEDAKGLKYEYDLAGTAAVPLINQLGTYTKNGQVDPRYSVAYANTLTQALTSLKDDRLISPFLKKLEQDTGVDPQAFLGLAKGNASLTAVADGIQQQIDRGVAAELRAAKVSEANLAEVQRYMDEYQTTVGVRPGSALAKAYNELMAGTGLTPLVGTETTTGEKTKGKEPGISPYLDDTRERLKKELDRLANGNDDASLQARGQLLASPEFARWAQINGYSGYRPEQQLKAFVAIAERRVDNQDEAFRAQLDKDILAGKTGGNVLAQGIRRGGALLRTAMRGVSEAGRPSADLTGGAQAPDEKGAGIPESKAAEAKPDAGTAADQKAAAAAVGFEEDPLKYTQMRDAFDAQDAEARKEPRSKMDVAASEKLGTETREFSRTGDLARTDRTTRMAPDFSGKPKMAPGEDLTDADMLPTGLPYKRTGSQQALAARPQNEQVVQRVLSNPRFADVAKQYAALQTSKSEDPVAYAGALDELAARVRDQTGMRRSGELSLVDPLSPGQVQFAAVDANGDGTIDAEEAKGAIASEEKPTTSALDIETAPAPEPAPKTRGERMRGLLGMEPKTEAPDAADVEPADMPMTPPPAPAEAKPEAPKAPLMEYDVDLATEIEPAPKLELKPTPPKGEDWQPAETVPAEEQKPTGARTTMGTEAGEKIPTFSSFGAEAATQAASALAGRYTDIEQRMMAARRARRTNPLLG